MGLTKEYFLERFEEYEKILTKALERASYTLDPNEIILTLLSDKTGQAFLGLLVNTLITEVKTLPEQALTSECENLRLLAQRLHSLKEIK